MKRFRYSVTCDCRKKEKFEKSREGAATEKKVVSRTERRKWKASNRQTANETNMWRIFNNLCAWKVWLDEIKSHAKSEIFPVTVGEAEVAVSKLKPDKCLGKDKITAGRLKTRGQALRRANAERLAKYMRTAIAPRARSTSGTMLFMKRGGAEDLGNYRFITPLPQLCKLYGFLSTKTYSKMWNLTKDKWASKAATPVLITYNPTIIRKRKEYRVLVILAFVDCGMASDLVETNAYLNALHKAGVNPAYVNVARNVNTGCIADIKLLSEICQVSIKKGVRQGDSISPRFFCDDFAVSFTKNSIWSWHYCCQWKFSSYFVRGRLCLFRKQSRWPTARSLRTSGKVKKCRFDDKFKENKVDEKWPVCTGSHHRNGTEVEEVNGCISLGQQFQSNFPCGEWTRRRKAA